MVDEEKSMLLKVEDNEEDFEEEVRLEKAYNPYDTLGEDVEHNQPGNNEVELLSNSNKVYLFQM